MVIAVGEKIKQEGVSGLGAGYTFKELWAEWVFPNSRHALLNLLEEKTFPKFSATVLQAEHQDTLNREETHGSCPPEADSQ